MGTLWAETKPDHRWVRRDGAVVKWDDTSPYPNPALASALMWTAWEPSPSTAYLIRYGKRGSGYPRRWKTARAAIRAVDREFPLYLADLKETEMSVTKAAYCRHCKTETEHTHMHDTAHGIAETHMAGSERFECTVCHLKTFASDSSNFVFILDQPDGS